MMRIASLATIPGREGELFACLLSLLPQFDEVHVVCNYGEVPPPEWLPGMQAAHPNLWAMVADNHYGDAAKFMPLQGATDSYLFTCDDDLIYPPDYADYMCGMIDALDKRAAVSMAGALILGPISSYYRGRLPVGHCLHDQPQHVRCNVLGTGVLAWHSDLLLVTVDDTTFPTRNMADVHFAVLCQRQQIPMVCVAHEALRYPASMAGKWTIWDCQAEHDAIQAARCNEVEEWRVYA